MESIRTCMFRCHYSTVFNAMGEDRLMEKKNVLKFNSRINFEACVSIPQNECF